MKKRTIIGTVIILIVLLLIAGGVWYAVSIPEAEAPTGITDTSTSTGNIVTHSTTTQKKVTPPCCEGSYWNGEVITKDGQRWYRNEAYGFEFQLPEGMEPGGFNTYRGTFTFYIDKTPQGNFLFTGGLDKTGKGFKELSTDYPGRRINPSLHLGDFTWRSFDYYRFEPDPYPNHGEYTVFFMKENEQLYILRVSYVEETKQEVKNKLQKAHLIFSTFRTFSPDSGFRGPKDEN